MNPLLSAFAQWAEALANGALGLDATSRERLRHFDGRCIQFETPLEEPVTVEFIGDRMRIMARAVERPNAIVRGSPASLLAIAMDGSATDIRIEGDETLVQDFRAFLAELRPDLAQPLARVLGDSGADTLVGFFELGGRALGRLAESIRDEGSRTMTGSAHRQFLDVETLAAFSEQVLAAQLAIDRLEARISRLGAARGDAT